MDSLALLCNLYGDGPATLRRLREMGLASLEAIADAEPEKLAGILRTSVRAARRFQAEGRLLIARTAAGEPTAAREASAPAEQEPSDPLLKKVLETWRRLDDEEVSPPSEPEAARSAPALPSAWAEPAMELDQAAIDGLDAAHRERLARCGIRTLEELTACDALQLASAQGIALTRVLHWQLLGRRALAGAKRGALAAEPQGEIELTEHGILRPAPPLAGARMRATALQEAPLAISGLANAMAAPDPTGYRHGLPRRFSPAEAPPIAAEARPELDLRAAPGAPTEAGPGAADALDSAGPFA